MEVLSHAGITVARLFATAALILLAAPPAPAQTGSEYEVKAAFLYKFASFVEWRDPLRGTPLSICIVGRDPFGDALDRLGKVQASGQQHLVVRRARSVADATGCQIIFISASERKSLKPILEHLRGSPALTVSDVPGFCETGGIVNLELVDERVRLQINPAAAERAGLQLSSKLLSLARIVREPEGSR